MDYRNIFDDRGHLYNEANSIAPRARIDETSCLLDWLKPSPGETIVVTAAGGGYDAMAIAEYLAPHRADIICVEPSRRFSREIPSSFRVFNDPLDRISLPDECADAVVNLAALHHCQPFDALLDEWGRLLRPGGSIVIGDVEAGSANGEFLNRFVDQMTPGGHDGTFLVPGVIGAYFASRGYVEVKERLEAYQWYFEDRESLRAFASRIFGMSKASPEEVESGLERYLGIVEPGAKAPVAIPWSLRFARATKPRKSGPGYSLPIAVDREAHQKRKSIRQGPA